MSTIRNILLYQLHQASETIHSLKQAHPGNFCPRKHESDWKAYQAAKHTASVCLTAIKILKLNGGACPENKAEFNKLFWDNRKALTNHARHGKKRTHAMAAFKMLRKLANRIENGAIPDLKALAEQHAAKRQAEFEARVAAGGEVASV